MILDHLKNYLRSDQDHLLKNDLDSFSISILILDKPPKYRKHTKNHVKLMYFKNTQKVSQKKLSDLIKKDGDEMILDQMKFRSEKNSYKIKDHAIFDLKS
jgi:hypothetical protein